MQSIKKKWRNRNCNFLKIKKQYIKYLCFFVSARVVNKQFHYLPFITKLEEKWYEPFTPFYFAFCALTKLYKRVEHLKYVPFTYLLTLTGRQTAEIDPHSRFISINEVTDKQKSFCVASHEWSFFLLSFFFFGSTASYFGYLSLFYDLMTPPGLIWLMVLRFLFDTCPPDHLATHSHSRSHSPSATKIWLFCNSCPLVVGSGGSE